MGEKGLNRLIVAGCESRILHKRFEQALEALGMAAGQIDLVNLRDHVAQVHSGGPPNWPARGPSSSAPPKLGWRP